MLSSLIFNVVPTFLEVALVSGILAVKCGPVFAGLTAGTIVAYGIFTFAVTQVSRSRPGLATSFHVTGQTMLRGMSIQAHHRCQECLKPCRMIA